jgi:hypothetical protein
MQNQLKVGSDTIFKLERETAASSKLLDTLKKDLSKCNQQQQKVCQICVPTPLPVPVLDMVFRSWSRSRWSCNNFREPEYFFLTPAQVG